MPRQQQRKQFLSFVGGLNTESSPLVFPENTAKALDNVALNRDGSVLRRRGIDLEALGAYSTTEVTDANFAEYATSAHEWESVEGDDSLNFSVIQIGGVLYFHKLGAAVLSTNVIGSIDLAPIKVRDDYEKFVISADDGKGKLFVVSRGISPAYIQYNEDTNTFVGVKLTIKVRDVDGIPEDRDSPVVFGDDITPLEANQTPPEEDYGDVADPFDPDTFLDSFDIIVSPSGGYEF